MLCELVVCLCSALSASHLFGSPGAVRVDPAASTTSYLHYCIAKPSAARLIPPQLALFTPQLIVPAHDRLASSSAAALLPYSQTYCQTKLGTKSVANIPKTTRTFTVPLFVYRKTTTTPTTTVIPPSITQTATATSTSVTDFTAPANQVTATITSTVSTTTTSVETDTEIDTVTTQIITSQSTTTTTTTTTTTATVATPSPGSPTTYAACQANNFANSANGGGAIDAINYYYDRSNLISVTASSDYDVCVQCQNTPGCNAFVRGGNNFLFVAVDGTCAPGTFRGEIFQTCSTDPPANGFGNIGNGPCGLFQNQGNAC